MKPAGLIASLFALGGLCAPAFGQEAPPTGEERAEILRQIHDRFPHMPPDVAGLFADVRQQFGKDLRCEVADWFAAGPEGLDAGAVEQGAAWADVCMLAVADITPQQTAARLAGQRFAVDVAGDVMTVVAQSDRQPIVCCGPQVDMIRLGDSPYWARRIRFHDLDQASTTVMAFDPEDADATQQAFRAPFLWRGPNAPVAHREIPYPELKGRVEKGFIDSVALGERRRISVYLPPGWTKERTWPAVFIGDEMHASFMTMVEAMIADGLIAPVVLVGVSAMATSSLDGEPMTDPTYGDIRNSQYMPNWETNNRFAQHLAFISDEVTAWAAREFNVSTRREERVVAGTSGGGTMALFVGLRRPDVFGYAIPMSPAYTLAGESDLKPGERAVFHMSGGLYEPSFQLSAKRNGARMKAAGYDVTVEHPASGHFPDHWKLVFGNALLRFFPKAPAP